MKNKQKNLTLILTTLLLSIFLVACSGDSESASSDSTGTDSDGEIVIKISSALSAGHVWFESTFDPWMERVVEETDGKVKFELYTGGELVQTGNELDALETGLIDIAMPLLTPYDPSRFPLSGVTMLPTTKSDTPIASEAFNRLMYEENTVTGEDSFYDYEFANKNLKAWAVAMGDPYSIATTGEPINSVEELKSLQLRTPTQITEMFTNHVGATPISMPVTDTYDALSRGTVDGTYLALGDWVSYGYQDVLTYSLEGVNIGHFNSVIAMTQDTWDSLPEDVQEVMDTAIKEITSGDLPATVMASYDAETRELAGAEGAVFEHVEDKPGEIKDALTDAMVATWEEWIESAEKAGHPGKEVAKLWSEYIKEAGGEIPEGLNFD